MNTDVVVRLSTLGFLPFFICKCPLQLNDFYFWDDTNGDTTRPILGDIISVSMKTENNDPSCVGSNLYTIDLRNEMAGLPSLDPARNADVGLGCLRYRLGDFPLEPHSIFKY